MKWTSAPLLIWIVLTSCTNNVSPAEPADLPDSILTAAIEYAKQADTLGPVIQRIEFSVAIVDQESRLVDYVPWISIEKAAAQLPGLKDPDKIVLQHQQVKVIIDYPLSHPVIFELATDGEGFSTQQLIAAISEKYHEIYKEEEQTAATKTVPADQREGLLNRNQTDGKYGIWGHDISDLSLGEIEVYQHKNGAIYLKLGIDS